MNETPSAIPEMISTRYPIRMSWPLSGEVMALIPSNTENPAPAMKMPNAASSE